MTTEHFFITGLMGCLGAWVARTLIRQDIPVTGYDLSTNRHRLELIMGDDDIERINFMQGDITNTEAIIEAIQKTGASHIIHLAALQVPFCKANPPLGAEVNVTGTVNMFEALFGFGANNRSKVAVLFHGNATYADPVFPKLVG